MNKRFLLRACASAGLAATMSMGFGGTVLAQESYPAAPITLVVPFAAGSGTDAVARVVANKLGERLKQPVVVDNRAGANAQIAAAVDLQVHTLQGMQKRWCLPQLAAWQAIAFADGLQLQQGRAQIVELHFHASVFPGRMASGRRQRTWCTRRLLYSASWG